MQPDPSDDAEDDDIDRRLAAAGLPNAYPVTDAPGGSLTNPTRSIFEDGAAGGPAAWHAHLRALREPIKPGTLPTDPAPAAAPAAPTPALASPAAKPAVANDITPDASADVAMPDLTGSTPTGAPATAKPTAAGNDPAALLGAGGTDDGADDVRGQYQRNQTATNKYLRGQGVQFQTDATGLSQPARDGQGNLLFKSQVITPLTRLEDGNAYRVSRDETGNHHYFPIDQGEPGVDYHLDQSTGEKYVSLPGADGGSRREVVGQDPFIPTVNALKGKLQGHAADHEQADLVASQAENGVAGADGLGSVPLASLRQQYAALSQPLQEAKSFLQRAQDYIGQGNTLSPADAGRFDRAQAIVKQQGSKIAPLEDEIASRQDAITQARQQRDGVAAARAGTNLVLRQVQDAAGDDDAPIIKNLAAVQSGQQIDGRWASRYERAGLLASTPQADGSSALALTDAGKSLIPQSRPAAPAQQPAADPKGRGGPATQPQGNDAISSAPGETGAAATPKRAYNIGPDGIVSLDPTNLVNGLLDANRDGYLDNDKLKGMLPSALQAEKAAQDQAGLQQRVSADDWAKAKSYAHGAAGGLSFIAGAAPGAVLGGNVGMAAGGLLGAGLTPFVGPEVIPPLLTGGRILGSVIGGLAGGKTSESVAQQVGSQLAQHSATIKSFQDAAQVYPGYDQAGQLTSFLLPAGGAIRNLAKVGELAGGGMEGAKAIANRVGLGAAGGAAFEGVARPTFDAAVNTGKDALGVQHDPTQMPTTGSIAQNAAIGALLAGHGIEFNKIGADELGSILNRGEARVRLNVDYNQQIPAEKLAKFSADNPGISKTDLADLARPLSAADRELFFRARDKAGKLASQGITPTATAIQATQGGQPIGAAKVDVQAKSLDQARPDQPSTSQNLLSPGYTPATPDSSSTPGTPAASSLVSQPPGQQPASSAPQASSSPTGTSPASTVPTAAGQAPSSTDDDSQRTAHLAQLTTARDGQVALLKSPSLSETDRASVQAMADTLTARINSLSEQSPPAAPATSDDVAPGEPASEVPAGSKRPASSAQGPKAEAPAPHAGDSSLVGVGAEPSGKDSTNPDTDAVLPTDPHEALAARVNAGATTDLDGAKGSTAFQVLSRIHHGGGEVTPDLARDISAKVATIRADASLDMPAKQDALRKLVVDGLPTEEHTEDAAPAAPSAPNSPAAPSSPATTYDKVVGDKLDAKRTAFHADSGTLGIPRDQMPQVAAEHRGAMANFLPARGIKVSAEDVVPSTLKPSQGEFNPAKVEKARQIAQQQKAAGESGRKILYSEDGHVIDGHHQWLAHLKDAPNAPMPGLKLHGTAHDILRQVHEFPSAGLEKAPDIAPRIETPARPGDRPAMTAARQWLANEREAGRQPTAGQMTKAVKVNFNDAEKILAEQAATESAANQPGERTPDRPRIETPARPNEKPVVTQARAWIAEQRQAGRKYEDIFRDLHKQFPIGIETARTIIAQQAAAEQVAKQNATAEAKAAAPTTTGEDVSNAPAIPAERPPVTEPSTGNGKQAAKVLARLQTKLDAGEVLTPEERGMRRQWQEVLDRDLNRQALGKNPQPVSEAGHVAQAAIEKFQQAKAAGAKLPPSEHASWTNHLRVLESDFTRQRLAIEQRQAQPSSSALPSGDVSQSNSKSLASKGEPGPSGQSAVSDQTKPAATPIPTFKVRQPIVYKGRVGAIESIDGDHATVRLSATTDPKTGANLITMRVRKAPLSSLTAATKAKPASAPSAPLDPKRPLALGDQVKMQDSWNPHTITRITPNGSAVLTSPTTGKAITVPGKVALAKRVDLPAPVVPAEGEIAPEVAKTVAERQIAANGPLLTGLGVQEVYYGPVESPSGVEIGGGSLRIEPAKLAESLRNVRNSQRNLGLEGTAEDWFSQVLAHEGIHSADAMVAHAKGQTLEERYADKPEGLPNSAMPEGWEKTGREVYGAENWDPLPEWAKKAEFVRQVVEGKWTGRITEALQKFIRDAVDFLKRVAGFEKADPRFQAHVEEVENRIATAAKVSTGARAPRSFTMPHAPTGIADVLDHIVEQGGIVSPAQAKNRPTYSKYQGDYDGAPVLRGIYHHGVYGGRLMPDQMAQILHENHGVGDGSVDGMWNAIGETVELRRKVRAQENNHALAEKQSNRFDKDALSSETAKGKVEVNTGNLALGDQVQVGDQSLKVVGIDPETMDVELEDHSKYGVQRVADGQVIYAERVTPADGGDASTLAASRPDHQTGNLFPEDDPFDLRSEEASDAERVAAAREAATRPAAPTETSNAVPTLRTGEKGTGDLFQGGDQPFNLAGEKGIDHAARQAAQEKADREAAEAKAKQDREQLDFTMAPVSEPAAEKPAPLSLSSKALTGITDFGEKIEGARKDRWGKFGRAMQTGLPADVADISLSKHFPEPDYEKLLADGVPEHDLATMKALRDMIPPKPQASYKLARWGELVKGMHEAMKQLVSPDGAVTSRKIDSLLADSRQLANNVNLYRELGYPAFTKAKDWTLRDGSFTTFMGKNYSPAKTIAYAENKGRMQMDIHSEAPTAAERSSEIAAKIKARLDAASDTAVPSARETSLSAHHDAVDTMAGIAGRQAKSSVQLDIPNELDRRSAGPLVEAGYDPKKLAADLAKVKASPNQKLAAKYAPAYQHAIDNLARLRDAAKGYRETDLAEDAAAEKAGLTPQWQARAKHIYEDPTSPQSTVPIEHGFGATKGFKTAADAIAAGVDPKSTDLADLAERRVTRNQRAIHEHAFQSGMAGMKASDGKPMLSSIEENSSKLNADGSVSSSIKVPPGYKAVQTGDNVIVAHKDIAQLLEALYGDSAVRDNFLGKLLLDLAAVIKHGSIGIDTYHGFQTAMRSLLGHGVADFRPGKASLDFADKDLDRAVKAGKITQAVADETRASRALDDGLVREGLNLGKATDNLLEAARQANLIERIPVLGHAAKTVAHITFHELQPGFMRMAARAAYAKNKARFPALSEQELLRRTAKEQNEFYGNMGTQGWLKSKTLQDASKVMFFAPGFAEGRFRTEARGMGQAASAVADGVRGRGWQARQEVAAELANDHLLP